MSKGYTSKPISFTRKMVIASVESNKQTGIHCLTEIDITKPRRFIKKYAEKKGLKLSFTAYLVRCFALVLKENPSFNSFLKRNKLIILDDVTISVLVERTIKGEQTPEPLGIQKAQDKKLIDIHAEIRKAQEETSDELGKLAKATWIKYIPGFLLKTFIKIADKNIKMAKKYGKVAITAVGMFSKTSTWFIPHGTATVLLTIGGITEKLVKHDDDFVPREMLSITATFDHDIIDGAPAARFMKELSDIISSGDILMKEIE